MATFHALCQISLTFLTGSHLLTSWKFPSLASEWNSERLNLSHGKPVCCLNIDVTTAIKAHKFNSFNRNSLVSIPGHFPRQPTKYSISLLQLDVLVKRVDGASGQARKGSNICSFLFLYLTLWCVDCFANGLLGTDTWSF